MQHSYCVTSGTKLHVFLFFLFSQRYIRKNRVSKKRIPPPTPPMKLNFFFSEKKSFFNSFSIKCIFPHYQILTFTEVCNTQKNDLRLEMESQKYTKYVFYFATSIEYLNIFSQRYRHFSKISIFDQIHAFDILHKKNFLEKICTYFINCKK